MSLRLPSLSLSRYASAFQVQVQVFPSWFKLHDSVMACNYMTITCIQVTSSGILCTWFMAVRTCTYRYIPVQLNYLTLSNAVCNKSLLAKTKYKRQSLAKKSWIGQETFWKLNSIKKATKQTLLTFWSLQRLLLLLKSRRHKRFFIQQYLLCCRRKSFLEAMESLPVDKSK